MDVYDSHALTSILALLRSGIWILVIAEASPDTRRRGLDTDWQPRPIITPWKPQRSAGFPVQAGLLTQTEGEAKQTVHGL